MKPKKDEADYDKNNVEMEKRLVEGMTNWRGCLNHDYRENDSCNKPGSDHGILVNFSLNSLPPTYSFGQSCIKFERVYILTSLDLGNHPAECMSDGFDG